MFIKLFKTPNHYYCLDVNTSEILEIGYEAYRYLEQNLEKQEDKKNISGETIPTEIEALKEAGYLSEESKVKEIKHYLSYYIEDFLNRNLTKLTLQVTQDCNFRCKYCIYSEESNALQRSHSKKSMSWETAKNAIDFLWKHSVDSANINIAFYGGEPLLQMPIIERAIEYSEKLFEGKKLTFNITTNGTLLDKDKILYFQKHSVALTISLDGTKEVNDKNRVFKNGDGTYEIVIKKIALIREIAPEYLQMVSISMVMDPANDFDCFNEIFFTQEDVSKLSVATSIVDKDYDDESVNFSNDYTWKSQYQNFLAILSHFGRYEKEKVSPIALASVNTEISKRFEIERMGGLCEKDAPSGPCIPGQMRLFCNVDGKLYPCERVSEKSSTMCIGSIDTGFDFNKAIALLNVGEITSDVCKNCWCFRYCTLCCKKADSGEDVLDAEKKLTFCEEAKQIAHTKIMKHLFFKECNTDYANQTRPTI